jgi:hypothetical protein
VPIRHVALALALVLSLPTLAQAQKAPPPEDVVEVTPPPEARPVAPPASGFAGFHYELFGILRLKGGFVQDDPNVQFVGRNDGFALQNARVGLTGRWERLSFRFSAEGAVDERSGANATSGTLRFALKDAFLDVRVADALSIRVVRFEPIFDLEEYIPYSERAFVDFALESRGVLPTEGYQVAGMSPGRSVGVAVRADRALAAGPVDFGYELAVQNGNGEYAADNDNDSLAFSAALFARHDKSFFFLAGRQKSRTVGDLPFRQTQDDLEGAAGAVLHVGPVQVAGQVLGRHTSFPTTGGPDENSFGAHAQLVVSLGLAGDKLVLEPGYRFAIYDPSDLISTDRVQEHTLGVTLRLTQVPIRLQLNYTHVVEQAGRELDNDRGEAAFEVSL